MIATILLPGVMTAWAVTPEPGSPIIAAAFAGWSGPSGQTPAEAAGSTMPEVMPEVVAVERTSVQPLSGRDREDVAWLSSILKNPANDDETRAGAATRLLDMNHPEAMEPLKSALRSGDASRRRAVLSVMRRRMVLPRELLLAGVEAVRHVSESGIEPLAVVLAQHERTTLPVLADLARDQDEEVSVRRKAIESLGSFRSRGAAIELIGLLDPARDESQAIIEAACLALKRATGLPYEVEPERWRDWWEQARDLPDEQWLTNMVQRLAEQLLAKEREIQRQRERAARIERRLAETYRDLFPRHSIDEQIRALPELLDDTLPTVRGFGLDTVARLLRDSVRIPEELQQKIIAHLNDDEPALRIQAAQLIDQLNVDGAVEHLSTRLEQESKPEVVTAILQLLRRRPATGVIPTVLARLEQIEFRAPATRVLWSIVSEANPDEGQREAIHGAVRAHEDWRETPSLARLVAATLPNGDLEIGEALLDGDDAPVRLAVAEGMLVRGLLQPLLDRAGDPELYPFALRAAERTEGDSARFRAVVRLAPPEGQETRWREAVLRAAARLDGDALLDADNQLIASAHATETLRAETLRRAVDLYPEIESEDVRQQLVVRYAQTLLRLNELAPAHEVMQLLNDRPLEGIAREVRFEVALLVGDYSAAAAVHSQPDAWLEAASRFEVSWPDRVRDLIVQIEERFQGQLNETQQAEFEALRQRYLAPDVDPEVSDDVPAERAGEGDDRDEDDSGETDEAGGAPDAAAKN